jgi:hypothetical protein
MIEIVCITFGAFFAFFGYLAFRDYEPKKTEHALRSATRWPIGELPENTHGRIVGRARAVDKTLTSPLTGRTCLYYVVRVLEAKGRSRMTVFHEILREADGVPFLIEDDTGRALIDPRDSQITLDGDRATESGNFDDATPVEQALLKRHGKDSKGWVFNKLLSYEESVIEVGETVAVLGSGIREPDPDATPNATYRGDAPTRLRLTSSAKHPLVISDLPTTTGD